MAEGVYTSPGETLDSGAACLHCVAFALLGIMQRDAYMCYCQHSLPVDFGGGPDMGVPRLLYFLLPR